MSNALIPIEAIQYRILVLRGNKVLVDNDLAVLYGVSTKRLNEQVKRNSGRFPDDFMFQLTEEEKKEVVANCDHLTSLKFSPVLPFAFTEHGAFMAANVLRSEQAVRSLIAPPQQKKRAIGFNVREGRVQYRVTRGRRNEQPV